MFPRMFGVEIELNTEDRYDGEHLKILNGMAVITHYNHRIPRVSIKLQPGWKAVYDGTCGSELVSPPMMDVSSVRKQLDAVKESGLEYTFRRTGLHIHVTAIDMEEDDVINVAKFCRYFDRTIFSFMDKNRIKNYMCKSISKSNATISQEIKVNKSCNTRYLGCNVQAWFKHGTIEFRYAKGTDDPMRIAALAELYTKIVEWVKKNPSRVGKLRCKPNIKKKRQYMLDLLDVSFLSRQMLLKE